jgi:MFS family permease
VVSQFWGMNTAFYIMGGLNLVSMLSVLLFLPEIVERRKSAGQFSLKGITASGVTRGIFSYQLGANANRGIMTTFIPVFAVTAAVGLNSSLVGTLLTIGIVVNSLLQIPTGSLSDKFSRRKMIFIGSAGIALSMALTPLANGFWMLLAFLLIGGIADAISTPPAMAAIVQEGRKYGMGISTSVANMGAGIGMGIAPIVAGFAVDAFGVKSAFIVAALVVVVCSSVFGLLTRKTVTI